MQVAVGFFVARSFIFIICCCVMVSFGQETGKQFAGKEQPGATLERFTLKGGRSYEGIWDAGESQIHIVMRTNHVGNLSVSPDDILDRTRLGDASQVRLYSDVDMAEQVLLHNRQNSQAARARLIAAMADRNKLHQYWHGKNLPKQSSNAVMAKYKAMDDEVAGDRKALDAALAGFKKAKEAYFKAGGKTQYEPP